jgi:molecular chaperone DnaK
MNIGEAMYKTQAPGGAPPGTGGSGAGAAGGQGGAAGNEKVVDADFEEVDDQKKRGSA